MFKSLRRKPDLRIKVIPGPTFVCVFGTGGKHGGYDTHSTGIALYLRVSNVGVLPTSITNIKVGYHWKISSCNLKSWIRYRVGWFYLEESTVSLADFQGLIGENLKIYPFLLQRSAISGESSETYLEPGRSTNGVVYFEQAESWGACFPASRKLRTKIRIVVSDTFGRHYRLTTKVDRVSLKDAQKYNPKFGTTLSELHGKTAPTDLRLDRNGNLVPPSADNREAAT